MSRIAAKVREDKEQHPDRFCPVRGCLWKIKDGYGRDLGPCGNHPPKPTYATCDDYGHDYSQSKTVVEDAMGTRKRRVYYCCWCGAERPRRVKS